MIISLANVNFSGTGGGGGYQLPTATASRLGGVKIGSGVTVTADGTISVEGGSGSGAYTVMLSSSTPSDWDQTDLDALQDLVDYVDEQGGVPEVRIITGGYVFTLFDNEETTLTFAFVRPYIASPAEDPIFDGCISATQLVIDKTDLTASTIDEVSTDTVNPRRWYVASQEERDNIPAGEGDICVVEAHYNSFPEEFYEDLNNNTFVRTLRNFAAELGYPASLRLTLVESEYAEEGATDEPAANAVTLVTRSIDRSKYYRIEVTSTTIEEQTVDVYMTTSGSDKVINPELGYQFTMSLEQLTQTSPYFVDNNFKTAIQWSGATSYNKVWDLEYYTEARTYQFNNGEWIELGDASVANEALSMASSATLALDAKLDYQSGIRVQNVDVVRNNYANANDAVISFAIYEGTPSQIVSQHLMLHKSGTSDARNNPVVDELVQSKTVFDIVALTQAEYDALEQAGELVSTTLYAIIPSNS